MKLPTVEIDGASHFSDKTRWWKRKSLEIKPLDDTYGKIVETFVPAEPGDPEAVLITVPEMEQPE